MSAQCNIADVDPYRLGPLRDVRKLDERAKRGDLASAVGDARTTAAEVEITARRVAAARTAVDAARAAQVALVAAHASPAVLALADRYAARRRRDLEAALGEHLRARAAHTGRLDAIETARDRLSIARADKELIERHFARWREAQHKLAERRSD